ncbi:sortase domain-containing protein [Nocardioides coralli]|uniref:sortase domain-containing protein n=1 Tax=Nocardioides coralli TaxID=2872154 RepID=UPI001CA3FFEE|nr:sortase [Nocardioides coralli]QZY28800.1 sortase [Nocardioides coralli]
MTRTRYTPRHRAARPVRAGGRRVVVWSGASLALAGVGVLAWAGWQYVGSSWVSERRHTAIVDDLATAWQGGEDRVGAAGSAASAVVRIPRFGEDYAVPLLAGSSEEVLAAGIGHLEGTAGPGQRGNFVVAAHRVTHGEPFAELPALEPGDEVVVETAHHRFTYVLDTGGDELTVRFSDGWVTDPRPVSPDGRVEPPAGVGERLITLTTCAELFHTDDRLVAFGHLRSVESTV